LYHTGTTRMWSPALETTQPDPPPCRAATTRGASPCHYGAVGQNHPRRRFQMTRGHHSKVSIGSRQPRFAQCPRDRRRGVPCGMCGPVMTPPRSHRTPCPEVSPRGDRWIGAAFDRSVLVFSGAACGRASLRRQGRPPPGAASADANPPNSDQGWSTASAMREMLPAPYRNSSMDV
jgi:hypothetical protein